MIDQIVIPSAIDVSKRHEPTGALIGRRITGDDSAIAKSDRGDRARAAGKGALIGAAVPTGVGVAYGNSRYTNRAVEGTGSRARSIARHAAGVWHPRAIAEGAGILHAPVAVGALAGAAAVKSRRKVSKAGALVPMGGLGGPHKKAPTLARTGPKPQKGLLVSTARLARVGKALGPQTLEEAFKDMRGQRNALASSVERHQRDARGLLATHGNWKGRAIRNGFAAAGWKTAAAGAGATTVAGTAGGYAVGRRHKVHKAYRSFDPEDARQRRLGAMASGAALGGGALVASGGRQIRRDSRALGEHVRGAREVVEVEHNKRQLLREVGELPDKKMALVRLKSGGKVGTGAALLAGAGALMSDRHKKPWR